MNKIKGIFLIIFLLSGLEILAQDGTVKSFLKITKNNTGFSGIDMTNIKFLGSTLANIGDIDKDGNSDIATMCYNSSKGRRLILICFLNSDGSIKSAVEISEGKGGLPTNFTPNSIEGFGQSISSIGDLDKDGVNDIVVGNHGLSNKFGGEIYIFFLKSDGTVKQYSRIAEGISGFKGQINSEDDFGRSVCMIGDLDKDGVNDIAVGAVEDKGGLTGSVWILFLKTDGTVKSYKKLNSTSPLLSSLQIDGRFGQAIALLGDLNKDGVNDILVSLGNGNEGGTGRGSLRILFLNNDGTIKSVSKISSTSGNFSDSLQNYGQFGWAVCSLEDLDGDSVTDISVSAISYNKSCGAIWNIFLKSNGTCKSIQKITTDTGGFKAVLKPGDVFGTSLTSVGDLNGGGITDMISDASSDGEAGTNAGAFYILFLNGQTQFITPVASFIQSKDTIKINECVNFTDHSSNFPTSWKWAFQGGNSSSSTLQNPSNICFSAAGKYTMTLIATNTKGSDTATKTLVVKNPAGLHGLNSSSFTINPNPFSSYTNLITDIYLKDATLNIYNTNGQLVKQIEKISGQTILLKREGLPDGLYYFKLLQEKNNLITGKLIITENN